MGEAEKSIPGHCDPVLESIKVRLPAEGSNEMIRNRIVVEVQCSSSFRLFDQGAGRQCFSAILLHFSLIWEAFKILMSKPQPDGLNHALQLETQAPVFFKASW